MNYEHICPPLCLFVFDTCKVNINITSKNNEIPLTVTIYGFSVKLALIKIVRVDCI